MTNNKSVMQQALQTVGYYGLNNNGYEVIGLKENYVLRMFDAGEITAQPVCLLSDAMDIIDALRAAIAQPAKPHDLQKRLEALDFYEDIAEHYAKCAISPEALRDWVAERMDKPAIAQTKETK